MAAFDTPWTSSMSDKYSSAAAAPAEAPRDDATPNPTVAAFSPNQQTPSRTRNRGSIVIHQKSPLLLSTPPSVTRTLAYSHPFILPLNHFAGLLSWTTNDAWESFLLLAVFWFVVGYGDQVLRWTGPVILVAGLILGMYSRRYSPLSSTVWSNEKAKRKRAESDQRKSLDEIVETLRVFTDRCEVLLDPFLRLTDFLSTQSSATSATTRPALTTLFLRICAITPLWIGLALPYVHVITSRRVVLAVGTVGLTWHSYPARITRTILWRSRTIRRMCTILTGLDFANPLPSNSNSITPQASLAGQSNFLPPNQAANSVASAIQAKGTAPGVRFTFTLYENQRRWIGAGWTASLLAYERQAWTDEHLNPTPEPSNFTLPDTQEHGHGTTKWRWIRGSAWRVEGATTAGKERSAKRIGGGGGGDESGWVYYDNKWQDGRKVDGWGRYTRRRKWIRDAELVEVDPDNPDQSSGDDNNNNNEKQKEGTATPDAQKESNTRAAASDDNTSVSSPAKKKAAGSGGWFAGGGGGASAKATATVPPKLPRRRTNTNNERSDAFSGSTTASSTTRSVRNDSEEDVHTPAIRYKQGDYWDRSIGDGLAEGLS